MGTVGCGFGDSGAGVSWGGARGAVADQHVGEVGYEVAQSGVGRKSDIAGGGDAGRGRSDPVGRVEATECAGQQMGRAACILGRFDAQQCGLDELTSQEPERLRREPALGWPHESALTPFILFA